MVNNDDGTLDVVEHYMLMPSMADCGKYIKCEALQYDDAGELLFEHGSGVVDKKIMVTFPPQDIMEGKS